MNLLNKISRLLWKGIKWGSLFIVFAALISAIYNSTLPDRSEITKQLPFSEKAYIAEFLQLQRQLGNDVWPGWSDIQTPVIVYNEEYAFLFGYPNPPAGWLKMPQEEQRGHDWMPVKTNQFFGEPYYRQLLTDPAITPENFTVTVGDKWVATMQKREYAEIAFYNGFRSDLPPVIKLIFPYKVFWNLIMGDAENYIGGLAHEAFHSFQGTLAPEKLAEAETAARMTSQYPWNENHHSYGWKKEMDLLLKSYESETDSASARLITNYLNVRMERRKTALLSEDQILYEQKREWLEGLTKYAELKIGIAASKAHDYSPTSSLNDLPDFKNYETRREFLKRQIGEVQRTASRRDEGRFYYGGMLQAMMLDRLLPGWKDKAFNDGVYLEDLLRSSVNM